LTIALDDEAWERLCRLHEEARGLSGEAREACLAAANPDLAAEVREMLSGAELDLERQLDRGDDDASLAGTRVGAYLLLRLIGRGGMGEVYLAERTGPGFEQLVAVKLLRASLLTADARERFERERHIQARLNHPAVVPLLDAGVAPDGRPFLVLQYVDGLPITRHADEKRLDVDSRLRLFVEVCRAVHHAHTRLVVHRDLKPSNVLVGEDGAVRLLDFGIAKLLDAEGDKPRDGITREAPAPMTPERAAPEQVRGEPVSTATDVWGLGVLLFELLVGRLPFDTTGRSPAEIERELLAGERQLTRALPAGAALAALAEERSTTPRRLRRFLAGDVQSVVGQALRPEPDRRFGSAAEFAEDVERLLEGRPVVARADSLGYRLRRLAGRHRTATVAAVIGVAGLLAFAVSSSVQSARLAKERDRAAAAAQRADAVVNLLVGLVGSTAPTEGAAVDRVSVAELLTQGERRVDALRGQPDVQAQMYLTLGRIHRERSEFAAARSLVDRGLQATTAADPVDPARVELIFERARVLFRQDQAAQAAAELRELRPRLERAKAPRTLAEAMTLLGESLGGEEGVDFLKRSLLLRRGLDPPDPVAVADGLNSLANVIWRLGQTAEARATWQEALDLLGPALGDDHVSTLVVLGNLAVVTEDLPQQIALHRRVLAARKRLLGSTSGPLANAWNNLGVALALHREYVEAEASLRESLAQRTAVLGPQHRETLSTRRNVARTLELQGRFDEALVEFEAVALGFRRSARPTDGTPALLVPAAVAAEHDIQRAQLLVRLGRLAEAQGLLEDALRNLGAPPASPLQRSNALLVLGRVALARADPATAERLAKEALVLREGVAPGAPRVAEAQADLGRALLAAGRRAEARPLLEGALPRLAPWGMAHPDDVAAVRAALAASGG
jgi:serine/threonine-protein kinase